MKRSDVCMNKCVNTLSKKEVYSIHDENCFKKMDSEVVVVLEKNIRGRDKELMFYLDQFRKL